MDYEEKYKSALKWMQSLYGGLHGVTKEEAEKYFPELKESNSERIKFLIKGCVYASNITPEGREEIFAWLEKQGKQDARYEDIEKLLEADTIYHPWAEMWWSERNKEYDAKFGKSGEYLILHDNNGFATLRDDDNKPIQVTHWMRIEPPAVLSGLERTEKKWGRIEYGQ